MASHKNADFFKAVILILGKKGNTDRIIEKINF